MTSRAATAVEAPGESKTVRELLDDARACESSDAAAARGLAQQARVLARTNGDGAGEAEALYRLSSISYLSGRPDDAFTIALDARDLARKAGSTVVEVWALNLIGLVHYKAGNFSEALESALLALELYRLTDHRVDEGNLLNTIAIIHHSLGDTDRALVTYEAALTSNKRINRPDLDVLTLSNMAEVRAGRNENLLAVSLGEAALELSRAHYLEFAPEILARLAESYCALMAVDRATACLDEAEQMLADHHTQGRDGAAGGTTTFALAMARGKVAAENGMHEQAVEHFAAALRVATDANMVENELRAHTELATAYKELKQFEAALHHQEARFARHAMLFSQGTDLRIKTLQIAYDTEAARQQAEILRLRTGELEDLIRGRTYDLEEYQLEAFQRLAVLAEFRDTDTGEHTVRVGDLAAEIALELGEPAEWSEQLRLAGRLHDIGKVAVPDAILLKPGPLTSDEFDVMKTHTTVGSEILSGSTSPLIQLAAEVALNHHERWDGTGYPAGRMSDDIPLSGRVVTVADVYDALISRRAYKHAWSSVEAFEYVVHGRGAQFDPRVVDAFVNVFRRRHPHAPGDVLLS